MPRKKITTPAEELLRIGIDLGNAYSVLCALIAMGRVECFRDLNDTVSVPSMVHFDRNGDIYVGYAAANMEQRDPYRSIRYFKRVMAQNDPDGNPVPAFTDENNKDYSAEDVAAIFLERLKKSFEEQLGKPVGYAVVTVPENYPDAAKVRTKQAALRAGFTAVRIVSEPVAASTAYGLEKEAQGLILTYDLGAGTFDVSILEIRNGRYEVLATGGEENLGGIDFDGLLIDHIEAQYQMQFGEAIDIRSDLPLFVSVNEAVQQVKHGLSAVESKTLMCIINGRQISCEVTRKAFEKMIQPYLDKMERILREVVQMAGITMGQLNNVILVGGGSKIPAVRAMVARVTGQTPKCDVDPGIVVAIGAAYLAKLANFAPGADRFIDDSPTDDETALVLRGKATELVLKSPHALGVEALVRSTGQMVLAEIIPANAPLGQVFTRKFQPEHSFMTTVDIKVLQGKANASASECRVIAELRDIPIAVGSVVEESVEVSFYYDIDGLVVIKVRDLATQKVVGQHKVKLND